MRLGFDLDEVFVNLTAEFEKYLQDTYGIAWPADCFVSYKFSDCAFLPDDTDKNNLIIQDMLSLFKKPDLYEQAVPYKDAVQVIIELRRRGHKIYFVSSRPRQLQPMTFRWLRRHGVPFDGLKVVGSTTHKGAYGRRLHLDMFVDDLEANLESMLAFKKRWRKGLLLMNRPWNASPIDETKFTRVDDWRGILRHVGIQNR